MHKFVNLSSLQKEQTNKLINLLGYAVISQAGKIPNRRICHPDLYLAVIISVKYSSVRDFIWSVYSGIWTQHGNTRATHVVIINYKQILQIVLVCSGQFLTLYMTAG